MKKRTYISLLLLAAAPIALFAVSTDRKIEDAARASYNYHKILEDRVNVESRDGVVTLTGTVQDQTDKVLAGDTAENIPGVTRVENNILVKSAYPEKSDSWMAVKIRSRLLMKANVSAATTFVAVYEGVVTLSGTASSLAQKELTEAYAKDIDGVKSVKNEIIVQEKAANATLGEAIDDASITSQVKYALLTHRSTSALTTKVTTANGAVSVTGIANSEAEKSLVTKLARDVRGAKSVTNDMTVKS